MQAVVLHEHVPALWSEVERLERIAATIPGDAFSALHGDHHALLLDLTPECGCRHRESQPSFLDGERACP